VPLLLALAGPPGPAGRASGVAPARAFTLGLASGLLYFIGTIHWTATVVQQFGGLSVPLAVAAMLLLAAYLALYPAIAALATARLVRHAGAAGLLVFPAAWTASEYIRGHLFGGFPWVPLGSSQATVLPVAQMASLAGVYGLSGFVASVNALLAVALIDGGRRRTRAGVAIAVLLVTAGGWGSWRIARGGLGDTGAPLAVGLIQGNIPQDEKWDPARADRILTTYADLSRAAVARGAAFVIWPESSTPFMLEEDPRGEAVRALVRELGVPLLVGSEEFQPLPEPRLYNAAFLLQHDGTTAAVYRKIRLVPFGEYIPLRRWLFFVSPLVERLAEFAPGDAPVMLPVGDGLASTSICYEVVYPELVRAAVLAGSDLLTTITNDAWYGHSSAPYQHFELASLRAIEQGRFLVRAANTGISGVVDPYGRAVERSGIFEQTAIVREIRLLAGRTVYQVIGDAAAWAAIALTLAAIVGTRRRAGQGARTRSPESGITTLAGAGFRLR